jgi:hypothetical protein
MCDTYYLFSGNVRERRFVDRIGRGVTSGN